MGVFLVMMITIMMIRKLRIRKLLEVVPTYYMFLEPLYSTVVYGSIVCTVHVYTTVYVYTKVHYTVHVYSICGAPGVCCQFPLYLLVLGNGMAQVRLGAE